MTGGTAPLLLGWVGLTLAGLGIATVLIRRRVAESHPRR
ncbi:LPXTG cell wall anchor domain-containing protein [Microbacterium aurum]|nr:LPXTG cell wall anchor domain-containing protein [Microbacterium aurum]MBZ6371666.1 LPXTG cell wall anchor domain-containing protein [Microbacterium hominis]